MASSRQTDAGPTELRVFLAIAIPLLLLLIVFSSMASRRSQQNQAAAEAVHSSALGKHIDYVAHPDEAKAEGRRLAKEWRGDYLLLAAEDRRGLAGVTAGHGGDLIARDAKNREREA